MKYKSIYCLGSRAIDGEEECRVRKQDFAMFAEVGEDGLFEEGELGNV